ncbi:MAG: cyclic nucleotide-binding domain-containing protein [Myxococcota bacterium]
MDETERKVELLQESRYFHGLEREALLEVAKVSRLKPIAKGEVLIRQDSPADALYVLAEGTVEVYVEDSATGAGRLVKRMARGACFGEIAILTGFSRTATVRADDDGSVLLIDAADLEALLAREARVSLSMCKTLAAWIYSANIQDQYRYIHLESFGYQTELLTAVPLEMLEYYGAVPLQRDGQRVIVGMTDPTSLVAVDELRRHFPDMVIEVVAISTSDHDYLMAAARAEAIEVVEVV